MNTETTEVQSIEATDGAMSPADFLKQFKGAPDSDKIALFKENAPGHRIKLFTSPDGKRVYVLRGISAFELEQIQISNGVQTAAPNKQSDKVQQFVLSKCVLWTNTTASGRVTDTDLIAAGAGLVTTLTHIVNELSDFLDEVQIMRLSADL